MIQLFLFPENMTLVLSKEHNNNSHNLHLMVILNYIQQWNPNHELHNQ